MPAGLKRTLWALPLGGAVAIWAWWHGGGSNSPAAVAASLAVPPSVNASVSAPTAAGGESRPTAPDDAQREREDPMGTWALRHLCGRPWEAAFGAECLAALERRYQDTVPGFGRIPGTYHVPYRPVMLGKPVTWGEVFADTAAAVAAATEALARPDCLVPGGRIRVDLRDQCAADEMAKLAILRRECASLLFWYDDLEHRQDSWDRDSIPFDEPLDQTAHQKHLQRLNEGWFGAMWRLDKCRALPEEAMGVLGPIPRPDGSPHADGQIELTKAAARLGSDWALSSNLRWSLRNNDELLLDDDTIAVVAGERPVLAELLHMRRAEGAERVMHAVVAFRLGEALGVQVHSDGVMAFNGAVDFDQYRAAWRLAAPRLLKLGWALVVDAPDGGEPRRFEKPEDLWGNERWMEWDAEGRIRLEAHG